MIGACCNECSKFSGHFPVVLQGEGVCLVTLDELFVLWRMDIDWDPEPDMPAAEAALAEWRRES